VPQLHHLEPRARTGARRGQQRGERHVAGARADRLHLLEDRPRRRRGVDQQALARGGLGERRLEQLPHDAERELALEVAAVRGQHRHALGPRVSAQLGDEAALPDPGRTLDQHKPRRLPVAQHPVERGQLPIALQQGRVAPLHNFGHAHTQT